MSTLTASQESFLAASDAIFAQAATRAAALPANTVQVWPGGQTFTSIQAAINSISGASPQEQYQVAVGSGLYNESIQMKDNVWIVGAGQDVTIISAQPQQNPPQDVVNSAGNCGISEVTIKAPGGGWGSWPVGIKISGSGNFHISGVNIDVTDSGNGGNNIRGITNNTGSYSASLILGQSNITCSGVAQSTAVGIELFGMSGVTILVNLTTIQVSGATSNFGVSTAVNATATLEDSKIIANTWALYNSDGSAQITANQCTIDGPVSSGVVVNN